MLFISKQLRLCKKPYIYTKEHYKREENKKGAAHLSR